MIDRLDHLVLTVRSLVATRDFFVRGLELTDHVPEQGRVSLLFGREKINLHAAEGYADPAQGPVSPARQRRRLLHRRSSAGRREAKPLRQGSCNRLGPVEWNGALGAMRSLSLRDPDGNLVKIAEYATLPQGGGDKSP